jgi:hypothetical protein
MPEPLSIIVIICVGGSFLLLVYRTIKEYLRERSETRRRAQIENRWIGFHQHTITSTSMYFEPLARFVHMKVTSQDTRKFYPHTISYSLQTANHTNVELRTFSTRECIEVHGLTIEVATRTNVRRDGTVIDEVPTSWSIYYRPELANRFEDFMLTLSRQTSATLVTEPAQSRLPASPLSTTATTTTTTASTQHSNTTHTPPSRPRTSTSTIKSPTLSNGAHSSVRCRKDTRIESIPQLQETTTDHMDGHSVL